MRSQDWTGALDRRIDEARGLAERALSRIKAGGRVADVVIFERHATREQELIERRWPKQRLKDRT